MRMLPLSTKYRIHCTVGRVLIAYIVVKRLRMALYKSDCDFNDCELPSGQYIINCIFFFLRCF